MVAVAGDTTTLATGARLTCRVAVPLLPSLVAVIVATPAAPPVAVPIVLTVATLVLLELHVIVRPVRTFPFASLVTAVNVVVWFWRLVSSGGCTVTLATGGGVTVTDDVPVLVSAFALIVTVPTVTPVTRPVDETVATAGLADVQVTGRSVTMRPFASLTVAVSCTVRPTATLVGAGVTVTLPTGTGLTVIVDVPLLPSLVAVIVALFPPLPAPVTTPVDETVATVASLVLHAIVRPVRTFPFASFVTAVSCTVLPTSIVALEGVTVTLATGTGRIVTDAVPDTPSAVAVIVTAPVSTAVTTPLDVTVALAGLLELHETVRDTVFPFTSFTVAVSVVDWPTIIVVDEGVTVTLPTGAKVTFTVDVPLLPSLVAVIVTVPAATPVTAPVGETVATPGLLVDHATTRPVSTLPLASLTVAVSVIVCPTDTDAGDGVTVTLATGTIVTVTRAVPVTPSHVALTVASPAPTPNAPPVWSTNNTELLLEAQVIGRSVRTLPLASFTIAVNCVLEPFARVAPGGCSVTLATGTLDTVIAAVPLLPSIVAVTVVVPAATAFRTPASETVATDVLLLDHETGRPMTTLLFASRAIATSWLVWPTVIASGLGATVTVATAPCVTVIVAASLLPSAVPVIVAFPGPTAVTMPDAFTVATPSLLLVHTTARSLRMLFAAS